jgi:hypothetical protein
MSLAAVAQAVSVVSTLSSLLSSSDGKEENDDDKIISYGAGAYVENHSDYEFEQLEDTAGLWSGDDLDVPEYAHWLDPPADLIGPKQIMTCGYADQYVNDDRVEIEFCLAYYSKTSPVKGLGMLVLMWVEIAREDDDDAPVKYRAGASAMFTESVDHIRRPKGGRFIEHFSRLYHKRKALFLEGLTFLPSIVNTFAYSTGSNVKACGYYGSHMIRLLDPGEQNYRCQIAVTAAKTTRFEITVRPVSKRLVLPG